MSIRRTTQFAITPGRAWLGWLALCLTAMSPVQAHAQAAQAAPSLMLDRVVAVVNSQVILASDLDEELRLSVLDPGRGGRGELTPQQALQQLISRALIQQQIRQEDAQAAEPTPEEVAARLNETRNELPTCVRQNCSSDAGWKTFLAGHGLTPEEVETYLRHRIETLLFIEMRFRQGIRISQEEIATYYRDTLLPQYAPGEAIPSLDQVAPRIEEILLQQQVNVLFGDWLDNLRKQGDVEVLDPTLEASAAPGQQGAGRK
jgi:peptidyl-prolyl cis-trans isomerase SurA